MIVKEYDCLVKSLIHFRFNLVQVFFFYIMILFFLCGCNEEDEFKGSNYDFNLV